EIEEIITLSELLMMQGAPKFHKLARCYSTMINFAGGKTTPAEVHELMMKEVRESLGNAHAKEARQLMATTAVAMLVSFLMDGAPQGGEPGKKT
ncbi:MAG: hypothetical protein JKY54_08105, partial [Flavobacteriales bacterium]|nr:hypothetical protein [Flavobacteriales bacterium]